MGENKDNNLRISFYDWIIKDELIGILKGTDKTIRRLKFAIENDSLTAKSYPTIYNNFLFFSISLKDIVLTTILLFSCRSRNEKKLHLRNICLHLYEFLEDLKDYSGKPFEKELKTVTNDEKLLREFYVTKKNSQQMRLKHDAKLRHIRHNTIAHKDHDAIKLLNIINSINVRYIKDVLSDVVKLNRQIINLQTKILTLIEDRLVEKHEMEIQELKDKI